MSCMKNVRRSVKTRTVSSSPYKPVSVYSRASANFSMLCMVSCPDIYYTLTKRARRRSLMLAIQDGWTFSKTTINRQIPGLSQERRLPSPACQYRHYLTHSELIRNMRSCDTRPRTTLTIDDRIEDLLAKVLSFFPLW